MDRVYNFLEDCWEKYKFIISAILGVIIGVLYLKGYLVNVRGVTGTIVTFASIVIGVNGVFLTLVITLQESPAFERLKSIFPSFQKKLYISLRNQINFSLVVVILSIVINMLPPSPSIYLSALGVAIWFKFFMLTCIGSFFSVKLVTDIIVKNFDIPIRNRRD